MPPIATLKTHPLPTRPSAIGVETKEANVMRKIYVSDSGNDEDDGLTEKHQYVLGSDSSNFVKATTKSSLWGTLTQ